MRKVPNKPCYRVVNSRTGQVKARCSTKTNAKKQLRLLRALENNPQFRKTMRKRRAGGWPSLPSWLRSRQPAATEDTSAEDTSAVTSDNIYDLLAGIGLQPSPQLINEIIEYIKAPKDFKDFKDIDIDIVKACEKLMFIERKVGEREVRPINQEARRKIVMALHTLARSRNKQLSVKRSGCEVESD